MDSGSFGRRRRRKSVRRGSNAAPAVPFKKPRQEQRVGESEPLTGQNHENRDEDPDKDHREKRIPELD